MKLRLFKSSKTKSLSALETLSSHTLSNDDKQRLSLNNKTFDELTDEDNIQALYDLFKRIDIDLDPDNVLNLFAAVDINSRTCEQLEELHQLYSDLFYAIAIVKLHHSSEQCPDISKIVSEYFFHRFCVEHHSLKHGTHWEYDMAYIETNLALTEIEQALIRQCHVLELTVHLSKEQIKYIDKWMDKVKALDSCSSCGCFF